MSTLQSATGRLTEIANYDSHDHDDQENGLPCLSPEQAKALITNYNEQTARLKAMGEQMERMLSRVNVVREVVASMLQ